MKRLMMILALIWVSKDFMTLKGAVEFLNSLPAERAVEAKVLALNSERSGMFNGYYAVVYRAER